jgi:acyl-CoA reductase-like NAD-dependent aldehyde dehydrogenase
VNKVAQELFWAAFGNSGQICIATKRMYVHKDVYEPLKAALVEYAKSVKVGDGAQQGTQLGPIQNRPQYQRVVSLIQDARDKGYSFLMGGLPEEPKGYFVPITILDNPPEESRIVQEEQFGPVLPLLKFDDVDEAIARANASEYGLGASVWSGDADKSAGTHAFNWDGKTSAGSAAPAGDYRLVVSATNSDGAAMTPITYVTGQATAIEMINGVPTVTIGKTKAPVSSVISVTNPPQDAAA